MEFKEKKRPVEDFLFSLKLNLTPEDKMLLKKLMDSYFRKKKHFIDSKIKNIVGGILWSYSRINFLFQDDECWSQKELAKLLNIEPKTVSRTASAIMDSLKIDIFDSRFARKEIVDKDPRNDFFMTKEGFILHKNDIEKILLKKMQEKYKDILDTSNNSDNKNISDLENDPNANPIKKHKDTDKKLSDFFK